MIRDMQGSDCRYGRVVTVVMMRAAKALTNR